MGGGIWILLQIVSNDNKNKIHKYATVVARGNRNTSMSLKRKRFSRNIRTDKDLKVKRLLSMRNEYWFSPCSWFS